MDLIWGMGVGLFIGATLGFTTCALMVAAKRADDYSEMLNVIMQYERDREEYRPEVSE